MATPANLWIARGPPATYDRPMPYDALAESLRLIEHGLPEVPDRLSRRRRFAPVAVDVDGDVAVTMFARRGVSGTIWRDNHTLCRRRDGWQVLGGGSGNNTGGLLGDRSARRLSGDWVRTGGGGTNRDAGRLIPIPPHRWVRYATLQVAAEVATVDIAGRRRIVVPRHGTVCVVWGSRRPPTVTLRDAAANELGRPVL